MKKGLFALLFAVAGLTSCNPTPSTPEYSVPFVPDVYTLAFDYNYPNCPEQVISTCTEGELITATVPELPQRENWTATNKWSLSPAGSFDTWDFATRRVQDEDAINGKVTLYAMWDMDVLPEPPEPVKEYIDEINSTSGIVDGNLSASMNKKGVPMRVVSNFINLFSYSVDFKRDLQKGDKFEIIYESQILPDGTLVKSGNILYAGLVLRKQKISLYRFKDSNGKVDYYTEKGRALKKILDRKPLAKQNARISSPFGKRFHPVLRKYKIHWGVDYAAPTGTPIFAGGDGVVQVAKYNGSYGNYIKIRHNSEFSTAYGHMSRFAKGIRPGVRVTQGQVIAYVGSTGRSTGPHLHYEVIQNGRRVNPRTIKASTGENLSGNNLKKFNKLIAKLDNDFGKAFAKGKDIKLAKK